MTKFESQDIPALRLLADREPLILSLPSVFEDFDDTIADQIAYIQSQLMVLDPHTDYALVSVLTKRLEIFENFL